MASTKGRFFACSASVGAFLGAAAALVPASCGGTIETGTGGEGGTGGTGGAGGAEGTGGMVPDGGARIHDGSSELDGTLIDLDGQADSPHVPLDGGDVDMS
jgi:hypothetical protein